MASKIDIATSPDLIPMPPEMYIIYRYKYLLVLYCLGVLVLERIIDGTVNAYSISYFGNKQPRKTVSFNARNCKIFNCKISE